MGSSSILIGLRALYKQSQLQLIVGLANKTSVYDVRLRTSEPHGFPLHFTKLQKLC